MPDTKANIILIEDDSFISGMYFTKLTNLHFGVEIIEDGETAWQRLQQDPIPDLILLDVVLPKKDGFEILEDIRKDKRLSHVPVILLTNLGQKPDVEKGLALGADDYVIKAHFTPSEVVAKVTKLLEKNKPTQ